MLVFCYSVLLQCSSRKLGTRRRQQVNVSCIPHCCSPPFIGSPYPHACRGSYSCFQRTPNRWYSLNLQVWFCQAAPPSSHHLWGHVFLIWLVKPGGFTVQLCSWSCVEAIVFVDWRRGTTLICTNSNLFHAQKVALQNHLATLKITYLHGKLCSAFVQRNNHRGHVTSWQGNMVTRT